jgi:hypothetical protein
MVSGRGVAVPPLVLSFMRLRLDSLPLASERLGEPGRLMAFTRSGSPCFSLRPDGVFAPLEDAPDGGFVLPLSLALSLGSCFALASSSFLRSSSF